VIHFLASLSAFAVKKGGTIGLSRSSRFSQECSDPLRVYQGTIFYVNR
jgi:hypothetical protein